MMSSEEQEPRLAELVPKMRRIGNDDFSDYLDMRKAQFHQLVTSANGKLSSGISVKAPHLILTISPINQIECSYNAEYY